MKKNTFILIPQGHKFRKSGRAAQLSFIRLGFILLGAMAFGCGGASGKAGSKTGEGKTTETGDRVHSEKAKDDFGEAVKKYTVAKAAGWNSGSCKSVADEFQDVADDYDNMPEALYNVGAVYRECKMLSEAESAFKKVLKVYPKHQLSLAHLAVMKLEAGDDSGGQNLLKKAVSAGQNTPEVVPSWVNAATVSRRKARKTGDEKTFAKAQMNLRRALAIEAKYMPALYQLAMLYLDMAITTEKASFLDLAMIVCAHAINLNPEYGQIYHVMGMIYLQQSELVKALQSFQTAFEKEPKLFASLMNFAAINLNFRGYDASKMAFEKAIAIDPKSYDAHMGLGVALRGLGDYQGAKAEYEKAKNIDKKRTDYIFNLGVLEMDYLNTGTVEGFDKAKKVFKTFADNATAIHKKDPDGKGPDRSWYKKAQDRIALCERNKKQLIEAEKAMAEMEKMRIENEKKAAEMQAQMEKAKELEAKEAEGAVAPEDAVVEGEEDTAATPSPAPAAETDTGAAE